MTPLCRAEDSLLVVIDIQERLAGAMPAKVRESVATRTSLLMQAASALDIPIIATEQYPRGLGETVPDIQKRLDDTSNKVEKTCFSCSAESSFIDLVRKSYKRQIILTGMETHVCVLQTAIELQQDGLEVYVAEDAVCARGKLYHRNALRRLQARGIIISNSESVIFEWLRDASHPNFKQISALLKEV
jgi:nicotinamidase-related amidase